VAETVQEQGSTGDFTAVGLEFLPFFENIPSNSLEIQRFGRVWREGNGTAKTSYELDWAV
jgi:hypothetical protein